MREDKVSIKVSRTLHTELKQYVEAHGYKLEAVVERMLSSALTIEQKARQYEGQ